MMIDGVEKFLKDKMLKNNVNDIHGQANLYVRFRLYIFNRYLKIYNVFLGF